MLKILSFISAVILWLGFIYVSIVTIFVHFIPHFLGTRINDFIIYSLLLDLIILEIIALFFKKLPYKPQNLLFNWLEKISLL